MFQCLIPLEQQLLVPLQSQHVNMDLQLVADLPVELRGRRGPVAHIDVFLDGAIDNGEVAHVVDGSESN